MGAALTKHFANRISGLDMIYMILICFDVILSLIWTYMEIEFNYVEICHETSVSNTGTVGDLATRDLR